MATALSVVPQVYVDFQASPALVQGLTSDTVACTGLASRGPVNAPRYAGTLTEFISIFGPEVASAADPTQPLSLWKGAYAMDAQGVKNKLFTRVAGATAASAYVHLSNTAGGRMAALHAATPGTWANLLTYVVAAGASPSVFTLTITNPATGETDTLTNLPWANNTTLITAINQSAKLVVATIPVADSPLVAPTAVTSTATGTLPAGTYYGVMAYFNTLVGGDSPPSPESVAVTLGAPGNIVWSLPSGIGQTGVRLYMSTVPGGETYAGANYSGLSVTISALPAASAATPPTRSTSYANVGDASSIATPGAFAFPSVRSPGVGVGDNGENCPSSFFLGTLGTPNTGLYSFAGLDTKPQEVFIAQENVSADVTTWAQQAQIASDYNWLAVAALDKAMTSDVALTTLTSAPVTTLKASPTAKFLKVSYGGLFVQDSYFNAKLAYGVAGFYAAITAATDANTSAGYKALANVDSALYDLSVAQAEVLIIAGANPLRSVRGVGLAHARDVMLDGTEGFKARMDMLLRDAFGLIGVRYLQIPSTSERRQALQDETMDYLDVLAGNRLIPANAPLAAASGPGSATPAPSSGTSKKTGPVPSTVASVAPTTRNYQAVCNDANNLQGGSALPQLICDVVVTYFNNPVAVRFRVTTGTNVTVNVLPAV